MGYRIYGQNEIDTLQQILFYRELDFSLDDIKKLITSIGFDKESAFERHLFALKQKRHRFDTLRNRQIITMTKFLAASA